MLALMVTMLIMAGLISAYLFGLRLYEFTKPKISASDYARKTVGRLIGELRSADRIKVGQGSLAGFTEVAPGSRQEANAIQVFPTTNNHYVLYYRDSDKKLKRATNGALVAEIMATSVSNVLVFTSEDYAGNILTNNAGNRVIGVNLQFSQLEYPLVKVGGVNFYDYYQINTKVTKRKLPQP